MDVRAGKADYYVLPHATAGDASGVGERFSLGTKRAVEEARAELAKAGKPSAVVFRDVQGGPLYCGWHFYADRAAATAGPKDFETLEDFAPEDDEPAAAPELAEPSSATSATPKEEG